MPMLQLILEGLALNDKFIDERIRKPLGSNRRVGDVLYGGQHDQEFVTAQACNGVLGTCPSLKPFGDVLEEEITDRVPQ